MDDIHKWPIPIERSLYNELRHMSIDQGVSINQFIKPAIDIFKAELVKIRDTVIATRQKQLEEAKLVAENPILVTGKPVDPIGDILLEQTA